MKNLVLIISLILFVSNISYAEMILPSKSIENEVVEMERPSQAYNMMFRIKKDRNTIYNVLNLTPSQIDRMTEIEQDRYKEIVPVVEELMQTKSDIKQLKENNCPKAQINAKYKELNKLEKQIKKISSKYDKQFEKILNREQRSKYDMIQKLRYEDLNKIKKIDKYGKKQSDLRPFGCKISQPAYMEELKEQRSFKNRCKRLLNKD